MRSEHAVLAGSLPFDHRDPFDRMLIAQSTIDDLGLVSCDPAVQALHPGCIW